jgi:hypothetical protein
MFYQLMAEQHRRPQASWLAALVLSATVFGCNGLSGTSTRPKDQSMNSLTNLIAVSTERKSLIQEPIPSNLLADAINVSATIDYLRNHPDFTAYHLLFLLRHYAPKDYESLPADIKAEILCSSLANVQCLNDWGYLAPKEPYDGIAAQALLQVGKSALPYLLKLMNDKNDAPLFGTEEATMSHLYRYRRADFAYRYAMLVLGRQPTFPADASERDRLIIVLQRELSQSN